MSGTMRIRAGIGPGQKRGMLKIPDEETLAAIWRVRTRKGLIEYEQSGRFSKRHGPCVSCVLADGGADLNRDSREFS